MNGSMQLPASQGAMPATLHARDVNPGAIQAALPIVARVIGRSVNADVKVGGPRAYVEDQVIHLPALPLDDPQLEVLAFGWLLQQTAQLRYRKRVLAQSMLEGRLLDVVDGIRSERELTREYPGYVGYFSRLMTKLTQDNVIRRPAEEDPPTQKLHQYIAYQVRAHILGQAGLKEYAACAEALVRKSFPAGACVRIDAAIARMAALESSDESLLLVRDLLDLLKEEAKEPPQPPHSGDGDDRDSRDHQASEAPGAGQADGGSEETSPAATSPPGVDAGDATDADSQSALRENLRQALNPTEPAELGADLNDLVQQALQQGACEASPNSSYHAGDQLATEAFQEPNLAPEQVLLEVSAATLDLSLRIRSRIEAVRYSRKTHKPRGTRIDPRRLVRAMYGDPRIFQRMEQGVDINSAVLSLFDRSGSMGKRDRIRIARDSGLALTAALKPIRNVAVASATFPGYGVEADMVVDFNDSISQTAHRFRGVQPSGGTPLAGALLWGVDRLLQRPEPRKIMPVITDGVPHQLELCAATIARCWQGGIEVYGLGIDIEEEHSPKMQSLFPVWRSVKSLDELAPMLFELLEETLTLGITP